MRVLGVITARGGSKGVPRKNIAPLAGRPLLAYTADAALAAKRLTRVILSTDDDEIAAVGRACGLEVPFLRPAELARDETPSLDVVQHAVRELEARGDQYDAICLLQPTTPLRTAADIDACIELLEREQADTVISVLPVPAKYNPHWVYVGGGDGGLRLATGEATPIPRRQELPPAWHREGSVYVVRRDLLAAGTFYGPRVAGYPMDPRRSVNIDEPADFVRAEQMLLAMRNQDAAAPRVSFVVPSYKQAHLLAECLHSFQAQSVSEWEAIVVDDASPDGAEIAKVVDRLADPRVRLVRHELNRGLAAARNTGIRAAKAAYVSCIDSDDLIDPRYLECMLAVVEADSAIDCVTTGFQRFGAINDTKPARLPALSELVVGRQHALGAGVLLRKSVVEAIGGYDEHPTLRLGREDWEFYLRLFAQPVRGAHLPAPLYRYRIADASMNINCRGQEHVVLRYIYAKNRAIFRSAGRGREALALGYQRSEEAAGKAGRRWKALRMGLCAAWYEPNRHRLRRIARLALEAFRLPIPNRPAT